MVASLNKWLSISLVGYFLFTQTFTIKSGQQSPRHCDTEESDVEPRGIGGLHPLHVSTTEINHNATDKTFEISCRVFTDDFESALSKQYNTKADLSAANLKAQMDSLIKKYVSSHLQIKTDDKTTAIHYLGFENEDQATYAFFEVENIAVVKKVDVTDIILHDLYDDQISIIHVIVGGNRKSTKLDYPKKDATFNFD